MEVEAANRQRYWESFCQNALLIDGSPILNCVEEAIELDLIDQNQRGKKRFAKVLGTITSIYYPGG